MTIQTYNLNMIPGGVPVRVPVSQYDADSRGVVFNLYTGDLEFTVPDGAVVTCDGTKPDHKGVSVLCNYSGSTVTVTVTEQMAAVAGDVRCQLTVNKDGAVLGSANFVLVVERAPLGDDTDMSESEMSALAELNRQTAENAQKAQEVLNDINDAQEDLDDTITAAGTAQSNLNTTIANANTAKTNLTNATTTANTARTNLTNATTTANTAKTGLEAATTAAGTAEDSLEAATQTANTAKGQLDAANETAVDNLAALGNADEMAQKIPLVQGATAGNVPLLTAAGGLQDSGKQLTPAGIGAAPAVESTSYPGCYYRTANGVTEWLNPPMAPGVEYRTAERYNGKPVFVKLVNCGGFSDEKEVEFSDSSAAIALRTMANIGANTAPYLSSATSFTRTFFAVEAYRQKFKLHGGTYWTSDYPVTVTVWYYKE